MPDHGCEFRCYPDGSTNGVRLHRGWVAHGTKMISAKRTAWEFGRAQFVDDPVITNTNPPFVIAALQFLAARRPGNRRQTFEARHNARDQFCGQPMQFLFRKGHFDEIAPGLAATGGWTVASEPVVTSPALAGFAGSGPVVTSLAGFAFLRPQPPGARMEMPAAFRYLLAKPDRVLLINVSQPDEVQDIGGRLEI